MAQTQFYFGQKKRPRTVTFILDDTGYLGDIETDPQKDALFNFDLKKLEHNGKMKKNVDMKTLFENLECDIGDSPFHAKTRHNFVFESGIIESKHNKKDIEQAQFMKFGLLDMNQNIIKKMMVIHNL